MDTFIKLTEKNTELYSYYIDYNLEEDTEEEDDDEIYE
jgi:hypothetical protein